ncbi:hypothetical protein J1614_006832 [Plenodomus biglobosus]|nr:hypothetical protein J1614_006832 [Plenodomus biglobosus]
MWTRAAKLRSDTLDFQVFPGSTEVQIQMQHGNQWEEKSPTVTENWSVQIAARDHGPAILYAAAGV